MDPNEALKRVREGLALIESTPDDDSTVDVIDEALAAAARPVENF